MQAFWPVKGIEMTVADFLLECQTFVPGKFYLVSGPSSGALETLLDQAKVEIEANTPYDVLIYDSRSTVYYSQRNYSVDTTEAVLFEYVKLAAAGDFVVLIYNEFDRESKTQNPHPVNVVVDTVVVMRANSATIVGWRELYPLLGTIYYYNSRTGEITFIKDRHPTVP
jgi:hypothetical protein